jgi:hypothetical protein
MHAPYPNPPNPCSKAISISNHHHRRSANLPIDPLQPYTIPPTSLAHIPNRSSNILTIAIPPGVIPQQAITRALARERRNDMTDRTIIGTNPLPSNPTPLSAPQEQQVRDLYYKNVRAKCATEIESASPPHTPSNPLSNSTRTNVVVILEWDISESMESLLLTQRV